MIASASAPRPEGFPFTRSLSVVCEGGTAEYMLRLGGVQVDSGGNAASRLLVHKPGSPFGTLESPPGDAYQNEIAAFVDCIREGAQPVSGAPEHGRMAVRLALAVRELLRTGAVVAI